jgi:glycine cleavage system transcriptional repressor
MAQLIITAVGPDRTGIVGELTSHLHAAGANILDSRMINLRGEFAMMILVDVPDAKLARELPEIAQKMGLRVSIAAQESRARPVEGMRYRLKTYSMDQPGIIARLSSVLRELGVNIEELSARQESAPFAGTPLFSTEMRLTVPPNVSLGKLRESLVRCGNEINCDVDLDAET